MRIIAMGERRVLLSTYNGSIRNVDTKVAAMLLLEEVNLLYSDGFIDNNTADPIRRAIMVAFSEIDSLMAYSTHETSGAAIVMSRQTYRDKIVSDIVKNVDSTTATSTKQIHLVRGITGSGKTTYATQLKKRLGVDCIVETDHIKQILFDDLWSQGTGVCPEPRQLHKEASLICKKVVDELCKLGIDFILVQRFEKVEDAKSIVRISEEYGYNWNIYSITPDYVDVARNNITRSRALLNINTFSPGSLQRSIMKYTETASYFYRLAALPYVLSMCDVRQRPKRAFEETYYKKEGRNIYVDSNLSIHSPLLSSRESKDIEDYAIFTDIDMPRYQNFFQRSEDSEISFKKGTLVTLRSISRSASGTINLNNKDDSTSKRLQRFYAGNNPTHSLEYVVEFIYNNRYIDIKSEDDLRSFILDIVRRTTGLHYENLFRNNETGKYLLPGDVEDHFTDFISTLFDKMRFQRNRIHVASYILWSVDFTGHYFADGCTRISTLLAMWYLARTGFEIPNMTRRRDKEVSVRASYRRRFHMQRDDIYDPTVNKRKFEEFYGYYKSLFKKTARPVIPCAGGYIFNKKGEVLLLRSAKGKDLGKYVVPGGKMNRGECAEECFIRETREEAGISIENITLIGKRRYTAPSGRKYLMYDFTAQAATAEVTINNESVSGEWVAPIDINLSECTTSTVNGLDSYLYISEIIEGASHAQSEIFRLPDNQPHATGMLEDAYVKKKMSNYTWALESNPSNIVIHGLLPFRSAVSSALPSAENLEGKGGFVEKDRNSNSLRPSSILDIDNKTLHLFNFPGHDILRHYASLFSKHTIGTDHTVSVVRYHKIDQDLFRLTGLTNRIIRSGDVVYLGYSTRLKEYLLTGNTTPVSTTESFWYISSRFRLGDSIINVLECKFGHWGDISARLSWEICRLGAKSIIHSGKVGTLVDQSEVYSRVYIPSEFMVYNPDNGSISPPLIGNFLESFLPFQSGAHISCSTPLDETDQFLNESKGRKVETVDIESSKIAASVATYNKQYGRKIQFGAIHYASDYVGYPDDTFTSYNLSNEHDQKPQTWKNAILEDMFNVIIHTVSNPTQDASIVD